jgi:hypothetical protein
MGFSVPALQRLEKASGVLFLAAAGLFMIAYGWAPQLFLNSDLGWHLAQAQWSVDHGRFYQTDVMTYANAGGPLVQEYFLYQRLLWLVNHGGDPAVAALASLLLALVLALAYLHLRKARASWLTASLVLFLAIGLSVPRLTIRPELFTYLGIVLFGCLLKRRKDSWNFGIVALLFAAQVAWTHCHSGYVLGPAMAAAHGLWNMARSGMERKRIPAEFFFREAGVVGVVGLACLVHPDGWRRLLLPLHHQGSEAIHLFVTEMQGFVPDGADPLAYFLGALVLLTVAAAASRPRGIHWGFAVLWAAFVLLSFQTQRHLAVVAFLTPCLFLDLEGFLYGRRMLIPAVVIQVLLAGGLLVGAVGYHLNRSWKVCVQQDPRYPVPVLEWMRGNSVRGRLFHLPELGGWLQYEGYTDLETFADTGFGKYPEPLLRRLGLLYYHPEGLPEYLNAYQPDLCLLGREPFSWDWPRQLKKLGWRCWIVDKSGSLWARPGFRDDLPGLADNGMREIWASRHWLEFPDNLSLDESLRQIRVFHALGFTEEACAALLRAPEEALGASAYWKTWELFYGSENPPGEPTDNALRERLGRHPEGKESLVVRALLAERGGDPAAAIRLLETLPRSRSQAKGQEMLARLYLDAGQWERAESLLNDSRCFPPENGRRPQFLARCRLRQKDLKGAAFLYRQALYLSPFDRGLREEAGLFLETFPDPLLESLRRNPF